MSHRITSFGGGLNSRPHVVYAPSQARPPTHPPTHTGLYALTKSAKKHMYSYGESQSYRDDEVEELCIEALIRGSDGGVGRQVRQALRVRLHLHPSL